MLPETCDLDYIYAPLTAYRSAILQHLYNNVPQDAAVLDLGSGAVGFYWALAYLVKASALILSDRNPDIIAQLSHRIERLTPDNIYEEFSDVLTLATRHEMSNQTIDPEIWLYEFHDKLISLDVIDALNDQPQADHDAIIAIELFDCANTQDELFTMMGFCARSLKAGGVLTGCCLSYLEWDNDLERLAKDRLVGRLNPSSAMLKSTASQAGFTKLEIKTVETEMVKYPAAHFFSFYK